MKKLRIGITYTEKIDMYLSWLTASPIPIEPIVLPYQITNDNSTLGEHIEELLATLASLDGIVFSGGDDFSLEKLGMPNDEATMKKYHLTINKERDTVEWELAKAALAFSKPILGICRGMQLISILAGGSLFLDMLVEQATEQDHRAISSTESRYHPLFIDETSKLASIVGVTEGIINSRHHQAIKHVPSHLLKVVGKSPDNIIEAIEGINSDIILVQWHPEAMWKEIPTSPFSQKLREGFLSLVQKRA